MPQDRKNQQDKKDQDTPKDSERVSQANKGGPNEDYYNDRVPDADLDVSMGGKSGSKRGERKS